MKKLLNNFELIGIDTNIFIYYLNRRSTFYNLADQLFSTIAKKRLQIVTSILTLTELLSFQAPNKLLTRLEEELLLIPNLALIVVNHEIAKEAARIRRVYQLRISDSIHLATATISKVQVFITNDKTLIHFKEVPVRLLQPN